MLDHNPWGPIKEAFSLEYERSLFVIRNILHLLLNCNVKNEFYHGKYSIMNLYASLF